MKRINYRGVNNTAGLMVLKFKDLKWCSITRLVKAGYIQSQPKNVEDKSSIHIYLLQKVCDIKVINN